MTARLHRRQPLGLTLVSLLAALGCSSGARAPGQPTGVKAVAGNTRATVSWEDPIDRGGSGITGYLVTPSAGRDALPAVPAPSGTHELVIGGLTNGKAYTFTVAAKNADGTGSPSAPSPSVFPAAPPGVPTAITVAPGNGLVSVDWAAPAENGGSQVTGYLVTPWRGTEALTPTPVTGGATSARITGLVNGAAYSFTIASINAAGTGLASAHSPPVVPAAPPGVPRTVLATPGNGQAFLAWTAPADNGGSSVTGYLVTPLAGTTALPAVAVTTGATSATVTGLTNKTAYTFTVAATSAAGTGAASTASNAVTPAGPPGAPTAVTAALVTSGSGDVTVQWTAPADDGGNPLIGSLVTPMLGGSPKPSTLVAAGKSSAVISGLVFGKSYTFAVSAQNAIGTGPAVSSPPLQLTSSGFFGPASTSGTGGSPVALATADLDGDGVADLVIVGDSGTVSVHLGFGDGTFQRLPDLQVGSEPASVAVADFNGDGKPDLAVADAAGATVYVLLGVGDGTFLPPVAYAVGRTPISVAVGDLDGDGRVDLAVANFTDNTISVLLGKGDGTFKAATSIGSGGSSPRGLAIGNLNADGKLDLAVVNESSQTLGVLLGNGDGTFQAPALYSVGTGQRHPVSVLVGHLRSSGAADLIVADLSSSEVAVFLGNGDGTFAATPTHTAVGAAPLGQAAFDLNGDGNQDLVVANLGDNSLSVLFGKGDGTFQPPVSSPVGSEPYALVIQDLDGDGRADLAVINLADSSFSVLLQQVAAPAQ